VDPDFPLRLAAIEQVNALSRRFDDLVPRSELARGVTVDGRRYPLFNPMAGIHRPARFKGPAALTILTTAPRPDRPPPYEDVFDEQSGTIAYSYRRDGPHHPDNRALRAAYESQVPLIYLMGVAPSVYSVAAPVFVVADLPREERVLVQIGIRARDLGPEGPTSEELERRYALAERRVRLHQHQFRLQVLRAYRGRCTICALREPSLVQAAHIVEDRQTAGVAAIRNGLALCAIHHLAYDRMVLGIDAAGTVHIADRLLLEVDGPMLREGLQGFHRAAIELPKRRGDRPDPELLDERFRAFREAA
jgi:putative restriction endonuclease